MLHVLDSCVIQIGVIFQFLFIHYLHKCIFNAKTNEYVLGERWIKFSSLKNLNRIENIFIFHSQCDDFNLDRKQKLWFKVIQCRLFLRIHKTRVGGLVEVVVLKNKVIECENFVKSRVLFESCVWILSDYRSWEIQ